MNIELLDFVHFKCINTIVSLCLPHPYFYSTLCSLLEFYIGDDTDNNSYY